MSDQDDPKNVTPPPKSAPCNVDDLKLDTFGRSPRDLPGASGAASAGNLDSIPTGAAESTVHGPDLLSTESVVSPAVGVQLGQYRLQEKLGQGGMGAVFKALHTKLDKYVALKVLAPKVTRDRVTIGRFEREMKAVGRLEHVNIVRAMDAGEIDGTHYLVMEFLEGTDLQKLVQQRGPLPIATACELLRQAALGLAHAHANQLVHRDIKPSNLMLTTAGSVKVLDLGLARFRQPAPTGGSMAPTTGPSQILGTPDYMAPEQWDQANTVDHRVDLYALGCTLFYLLVGRPPYSDGRHSDLASKLAGHVLEPIPDLPAIRPDVPADLAALFRRLMAKKPSDRIASAAELATGLASFAEPSTAEVTDVSRQTTLRATRRPLHFAIAAALAVGLAAIGYWIGAALYPTAPRQHAADSAAIVSPGEKAVKGNDPKVAINPATTGPSEKSKTLPTDSASIAKPEVVSKKRIGETTKPVNEAPKPANERPTPARQQAESAFSQVNIESPFDKYLLANPLLMEVTGAKIIRLGDGRKVVLAVASTVLEDNSAAERVRAERVCRINADRSLVAEDKGIQVAHVEQLVEKITVVVDDSGEKAQSVSKLLRITKAKVEGIARVLPIVGRWRSKEGDVFYLAFGAICDRDGNPVAPEELK